MDYRIRSGRFSNDQGGDGPVTRVVGITIVKSEGDPVVHRISGKGYIADLRLTGIDPARNEVAVYDIKTLQEDRCLDNRTIEGHRFLNRAVSAEGGTSFSKLECHDKRMDVLLSMKDGRHRVSAMIRAVMLPLQMLPDVASNRKLTV